MNKHVAVSNNGCKRRDVIVRVVAQRATHAHLQRAGVPGRTLLPTGHHCPAAGGTAGRRRASRLHTQVRER